MDADAFSITTQATDVECTIPVVAWQPNGRNLYVAQAVGPRVPDWVRALEHATGPDASGISPASYPESNSARPAPQTTSALTRPGDAVQSQACAAVGIYETNGLPHGGFWVGDAGTHVAGMAWSPDSQLLAVVVVPEQQPVKRSCVQLWRRSNWHWYCLYEWRVDGLARVGWGEGGGSVLQCLVGDCLVQVRC